VPPDHVTLLKLVWHPDDIEGSQVKPTAFRSKELSGRPEDHVSVDRSDLAVRECMVATAANQQTKVDGQTVMRESAYVGRLHCGSVRLIFFKGAPALRVIPIPIQGNHAHCGIQNIAAEKGRSYLLEVRGKLAMLASPPVTFDEAYLDAS